MCARPPRTIGRHRRRRSRRLRASARTSSKQRRHVSSATTRRARRESVRAIATYDGAINCSARATEGDRFPTTCTLAVRAGAGLRYGENPHQRAPSTRARRRRPASRGAPAPGQGALLQQHRRYRRGLECVKQFTETRPASSSSTPTPAASPSARTSPTPTTRAYETRSRIGLRRHHRLQPASWTRRTAGPSCERQFVEVIIAPTVTEARAR